MKQTKIDWCDCTVNPVVGCERGCEYCYARKLNNRFGFIKDWSKPKFFPERLKEFESKKPKSIFINSMSDIASWETKWVVALFRAMIKNPQHRYIALTKNYSLWKCVYYDAMDELISTENIYLLDEIFFVGRTITENENYFVWRSDYPKFINIEPILEEIDANIFALKDSNQTKFLPEKLIIVGAETGNRKGKVVPKKEWIDKLVAFADEWQIPIFMKESLRNIMGKDFRQDKLPWED